jgi:hypothetical protein
MVLLGQEREWSAEAPGLRQQVRALADERRRARRLRMLVDCTMDLLLHERMTRVQAEALVETTRAAVLDLFPGSESTYNLLLAPRFSRVINERCGKETPSVAARPGARIIPFPGPRTPREGR